MLWDNIAVTTVRLATPDSTDNLAEEECPAGESYRDGKNIVPALCKPSLEGVFGREDENRCMPFVALLTPSCPVLTYLI